MKIRTGFVSNSSSTSFCAYGASVSEDKLIEVYNKYKKIKEKCKYRDIYLLLDEILENYKGLPQDSIIYNYTECELYIGRDYQSIGDGETGKEFKESTSKSLKELFDIDECYHMNHVIYDSWLHYDIYKIKQ